MQQNKESRQHKWVWPQKLKLSNVSLFLTAWENLAVVLSLGLFLCMCLNASMQETKQFPIEMFNWRPHTSSISYLRSVNVMIILKSYTDYHGCRRKGITEFRLENPFHKSTKQNLSYGNMEVCVGYFSSCFCFSQPETSLIGIQLNVFSPNQVCFACHNNW